MKRNTFKHIRRNKLLVVSLLIFSVLFLFVLADQELKMRELMVMEKQYDSEVAAAKKQVEDLKLQLSQMSTDEAKEAAARKFFKMSKEDEVLFIIEEDDSN